MRAMRVSEACGEGLREAYGSSRARMPRRMQEKRAGKEKHARFVISPTLAHAPSLRVAQSNSFSRTVQRFACCCYCTSVHVGCADAAAAVGRALISAAVCTKWQARLREDFKRWRDLQAAVSSSIRRSQQQAFIRGNDGIYCSAIDLSVDRVRASLSSHRQAATCVCHQDDDVWVRDAVKG